MSMGSEEQQYIDQWLRNVTKPEQFYVEHAMNRRYFYNIDLQGRLYLEDTDPKNISCSLKSEKFLNFFFKHVRRTSDDERQKIGGLNEYPFVSPCGSELNYIRPADCPIVFHSLIFDDSSNVSSLAFGGSLQQHFSFENIYISRNTHRLYHELQYNNENMMEEPLCKHPNDKIMLHRKLTGKREFGLIKSSLAVELAEQFEEAPLSAEFNIILPKERGIHKIPWLPGYAEPGTWGLT